MRGDDPRWGCVEPGCDAHPANPDNGVPIYRLSPKGQPFVGACGKHYAKHDAPAEGEAVDSQGTAWRVTVNGRPAGLVGPDVARLLQGDGGEVTLQAFRFGAPDVVLDERTVPAIKHGAHDEDLEANR